MNSEHMNQRVTAHSLRLCILENSYANMQLMIRTCHERGHHVDHFSSINDVIEANSQTIYDVLVVSDTMAGGADACEIAITKVRSQTDHNIAAIPILAITSTTEIGQIRALELFGATAILTELTTARFAAALAALADGEATPAKAHTGKKAALLLEKNHNLSLVLTHAITQTGHSVTHAINMEEAVAALDQNEFEILLLSQDDSPVQMSTVQFVEFVHSSCDSHTMPLRIWVLTDDVTPTNARALRLAGAEHVLDKRDPIRLCNALFTLSASKAGQKTNDTRTTESLYQPSASPSEPVKARKTTPPPKHQNSTSKFNSRLAGMALPAVGFFALTSVVAGGVWFGWQAFFAKTSVEAVTVQRGTLELTAAATGLVVSKRQVDLPPTQTGQLYRVYINEGDLVRKGEILATLDNREATVNVRRAEAQVYRYRTELDLAEKALRTWRETSDGEASPQIELDAESAHAGASIKLRVAEQELNGARVTLDRLKITAPFAGAITQSTAIEGKWVVAGTSLFTLSDLNSREVALRVPADLGRDLSPGLSVRVLAESKGGDVWQETVARVSNDTITVKRNGVRAHSTVYVTLGDDGTVLQLGQRVMARIVTDVESNVVIAPFNALVMRDGKSYANVVENDRIVTRMVELGINNEHNVVIRSGLKPGESIVTSRIPLNDGQRVAISNTLPTVSARQGDGGVSAR